MNGTVYTIGHSTHSVDNFIALLVQHSVTALSDVRSRPYSRFNPQFNREFLDQVLRTKGIVYVFLGRELGARTDDRTCYKNGKVLYDRLSETVSFKRGIARIIDGIGTHRIALMCAEKDPIDCHRGILIGRCLVEQGLKVQHILPDGRLECHQETLHRLLGKLGIPEIDLFRTRDQIVAEAYRIRGQTIAYAEQDSEVPS